MSEADRRIYNYLISSGIDDGQNAIVVVGKILEEEKLNPEEYIKALKNVAVHNMTWPRQFMAVKDCKDTNVKTIENCTIQSATDLEKKLNDYDLNGADPFDVSQELVYTVDKFGIYFSFNEYTDSKICFILSKP